MNIGIAQYLFQKDHKKMMKIAIDSIENAKQNKIDLLIFPPWFIALNPPEKEEGGPIANLLASCNKNKISILTGNIRVLEEGKKAKQVSIFINSNGEIQGKQQKLILYKAEQSWFLPGDKIEAINTKFGKLCVLNGQAVLTEKILKKIAKLSPDILVLQYSCLRNDVLNEIKELSKYLSYTISPVVTAAMMIGNWYGGNYIGGSFITFNGSIVSEANKDTRIISFSISKKLKCKEKYNSDIILNKFTTLFKEYQELQPANLKKKNNEKVLCIIGSPRKKGFTSQLVKEVIRGIKASGGNSEIIYLIDYKIDYCLGCLKCRKLKTCVIKDDMHQIYPKLESADIIILTSPSYNLNVTGLVKTFIDRCHPYYHLWENIISDDRMRGKKGATIAIYGSKNYEGNVLFSLGTFFSGRGIELLNELLIYTGEGISKYTKKRAYEFGKGIIKTFRNTDK